MARLPSASFAVIRRWALVRGTVVATVVALSGQTRASTTPLTLSGWQSNVLQCRSQFPGAPMPKRAMTPARKTQIAFWQAASKGKKRSWSNPIPARNAARGVQRGATIPGSFGAVRSHKLGGKAYTKKSGNTFKPAPEATAILAGKAAFRDPVKSHEQMVKALSPSKTFAGWGPYKPKKPKGLHPKVVH